MKGGIRISSSSVVGGVKREEQHTMISCRVDPNLVRGHNWTASAPAHPPHPA